MQTAAVDLGVFRQTAAVNNLGAAVFDDGGNRRAVNSLSAAIVDLRAGRLACHLHLL